MQLQPPVLTGTSAAAGHVLMPRDEMATCMRLCILIALHLQAPQGVPALNGTSA